ncbi:HEAT repeat-containing protein [Salinibacillus kushneri]|uniref:HEAT repeat-containing protein n=1 Tax=Salinibacillus kushneri TaxID=237682 RepID=A0A1H9YED4_9BACI|nr:conserved virulence factor C family protein [Salinibacillus kushneri]SES67360.1 HEAT repeat-containing protein [Salinibacillus kushneri]
MKIISIEPTPSPNSMKIILSEPLPEGETHNYRPDDDLGDAPAFIQELFKIEGVKNVYHVADFLALDRKPKLSWEEILPQVREVFGESDTVEQSEQEDAINREPFGEISVFIQMFRAIPMQVKIEDGHEEKRFGLPERFMNAVMKASADSPNFVMERKWVEQNPRYGAPEEVGEDVVEELSASYDEERLEELAEQALNPTPKDEATETIKKNKVSLETLDDPDWKVRYAALDRMDDPTVEDLPVLNKALDDEKMSVRRIATAYLGMIEEREALPYLYKALKDKVVTVRRTAGDCLSDLGFKEAIPEMITTLKDPSKIVRWRAAMFLYEVGDESALPALREAADDSEFEVRLQINMAIERIEGGHEAKGSVWHQMTQATNKK